VAVLRRQRPQPPPLAAVAATLINMPPSEVVGGGGWGRSRHPHHPRPPPPPLTAATTAGPGHSRGRPGWRAEGHAVVPPRDRLLRIAPSSERVTPSHGRHMAHHFPSLIRTRRCHPPARRPAPAARRLQPRPPTAHGRGSAPAASPPCRAVARCQTTAAPAHLLTSSTI
jgi:hypothetical protein